MPLQVKAHVFFRTKPQMSSCLSPSSYLTIVQMCAVVERRLLTDIQDSSISDPQLLCALEQHRVHCTGRVAEAWGRDSNKDFLGWEKVE